MVWQERDGGGVVTMIVLVLCQRSTDEGLGARQTGKTPLDLAIGRGHDAVAALLREVRWSRSGCMFLEPRTQQPKLRLDTNTPVPDLGLCDGLLVEGGELGGGGDCRVE